MKHILFFLLVCHCAFTTIIYGTDCEDVNSKSAVIAKMIENSELNTPLLDISTTSSSIVGGVVNVITGNYVENESDLLILGANPLCVQRCFNSGYNEKAVCAMVGTSISPVI